MRMVYFENSEEFLNKEACDLFEAVVGNSVQHLERLIKEQSKEMIQQIYSNKKFIYSDTLNYKGLHVYRTLLADRIHKKRKRISNRDVEHFDSKGFTKIANFLPQEEFANVKSAFDKHVVAKYPQGAKKHVDAMSFFQRNKHYSDLIMQCSHISIYSPDAPGGIPRTEFWNHYHEPEDSQYKFHSDTFQPTCKFWLYLEDIEDSQGPLTFVPGSHLATESRLKWDYENSRMKVGDNLWHRRIEKGGKPGSFRVYENSTPEEETSEIKRLGYDDIIAFSAPANTLIAVNTFGYHKRGYASEGTYRRTLTTQYRPVAFGEY